MLNREFILKQIRPFLNSKKELSEFEFNELFFALTRREQYEIITIMIDEGIEYVDEKPEETRSLSNAAILDNASSIAADFHSLFNLKNEQLCYIYQKGNNVALAALIEKNKRFIYELALKLHGQFRGSSLAVDDLYQEGTIGLIEAANRFDHEQDNAFITYSWHWIRQKITWAIMDTGFLIRIPVHAFEKIIFINKLRYANPNASIEELTVLFNEKQTDEAHILSTADINTYIRYSERYINFVSLNEVVGENDDSELMNFIPDEALSTEDIVLHHELYEQVNRALDDLNSKEKAILEMRFGLNGKESTTLVNIGSQFNLTRERIRQIESSAIKHLRQKAALETFKDY